MLIKTSIDWLWVSVPDGTHPDAVLPANGYCTMTNVEVHPLKNYDHARAIMGGGLFIGTVNGQRCAYFSLLQAPSYVNMKA